MVFEPMTSAMGPLTPVPIVLCVLRDVIRPLTRRFVEREDRFDRAGRHAGAAIDALVGMNIEHLDRRKRRFVLPGMNTVDRTDVHARGILGADAWLANDIRHGGYSTSVVRSGARPAVHAGAPAAGALPGLRVGRAAAAGQRGIDLSLIHI